MSTLATDLATLQGWIAQLPRVGATFMKKGGGAIYTLDFVMVGALKRAFSLASGFNEMVSSKNMMCARALLRMHLDTITRLHAYTYTEDPEGVAMEVLKGKKLSEFKSKDGKALRDGYLVDRFSEAYPWAANVYASTSGYVHFSESQFFDTVHSLDKKGPGTFELAIGPEDSKFPESSWQEVIACFNEITVVLVHTIESYYEQKGG